MRTRTALAALSLLALLVLAGCAEPAGSIRMDPVNDSELAERASYATTGGEFYPQIRQEEVAQRAIENGSTTVADVRVPARTDLPYRQAGRYYNLSYERVGSQPGLESLVAVDYNATDPNGSRVAFSELPERDQRVLGPVLANDPPRREPGPEVEFPIAYPEPDAEASALLSPEGTSLVVTYRGSEYAVTAREPREETLETYRYEATLRAESTAAYVRELKRTYAFDLRGLSEEERSVIGAALDDSYYADDTDDAGFAAVVERFRGKEALEADEHAGTWLARYDGQLYWVELRYSAFVEDDTEVSTTPEVTPP